MTVRPGAFQLLVLALTLLLYASPADAGEAFRPEDFHRHLEKREPITRPLPVTDLDEAYVYQDRLVELRSRQDGVPAGYKAALTSAAAQERFGYNRPVLGTVLKGMLLRDRVSLDQDFATRPLIEADLMVMVRDASINTAETREEILAAIESVHPLIELPDLAFAEQVNILPLWLTAMNAGACKSVAGDPVFPRDTADMMQRLGSIQASVFNKRGVRLATGRSDSLLGHPLHVVQWIRDEVKARGRSLKPGDVLWLGSITPPIPVEPGESYKVLYTGLADHPVSIQVNIRKRVPRESADATRSGMTETQ